MPEVPQSDVETLIILRFLIRHDLMSDSFYFGHGDRIGICENCNDLFAWACADCEEITVADLPDYERAINETKATGTGNDVYAGSLWACRKRRQKPQPASLRNMPEAIRPLFEQVEVQ